MTTTPHLRNRLFAAFAGFALMLASLPASAALPISEGMPTLAPIIEQTEPAVVNISTRGHIEARENPLFNDPFFRRFFEMPEQPQRRDATSLGSGVIIDAEEGYIVTNNHVIANADEVTVTLYDNTEYPAEVVGSDARTDVALLKIEAKNLKELPFADSENARVGDFVIAIGNPFGLAHTVTSGIVSAMGRAGMKADNFEDFIQTDASINPGNSGGALIDLKGRLLGVNTAILSRGGGNIGIGFAIPSNMVKLVVDQLIEFGEVKRGVLGVHVQSVTDELATAFELEGDEGALVASVVPDSSADNAGIQEGDVIVAVDGKPIKEFSDLRNRIGLMRVGQEVALEVIRDGKRKVVTATISDPAENVEKPSNLHPALRGATFGELDERSPLFGRIKGVLVSNVEQGTPAARAGGIGLRPGDVITSVNRQDVTSLKEFRELVTGSQGLLLMNIRRGNSALFIAVR